MSQTVDAALVAAAGAGAFVLAEKLLALVALEARTGALGTVAPLSEGEAFDGVAWVAIGVFFKLGSEEC